MRTNDRIAYTKESDWTRSLATGQVTASYNAQDQLVRYGTTTYRYTLNGDLETKTTLEGITTYRYNALGNLDQVILPNNSVIGYTYDAQGRLIGKRVNGTVTARYLYDGQLKIAAVVDGEGNVERRYLYALHANVPEAILEADGTTYRIIHDHLGGPRMVVNAATGEIVKEVAYDEFGNITAETGTYDLPFGFAGGIRDTDTGLTKFGARWYDPEVGRWISKEPLGFAGSMNFYTYAGNDPVNRVDVSGLKWEIIKNPYWTEAQNTAFVKMVNAAILKLRAYSPTAAIILDTIESDTKFNIRITDPSTDKRERGSRYSHFNDEGYSGTLYYDPSYTGPCTETPEWEINQPEEIGFIHEMIHAFHDRGGVYTRKEGYTPLGTNIDEEMFTVGLEEYAGESFTENQVRREYMRYYPLVIERREYFCR
ncbi:MAG TPA: RHS repeat-associated core domain-containing protein [bacterium]|nr:RHS repeat-associated core domain-containing protein [bacterium]